MVGWSSRRSADTGKNRRRGCRAGGRSAIHRVQGGPAMGGTHPRNPRDQHGDGRVPSRIRTDRPCRYDGADRSRLQSQWSPGDDPCRITADHRERPARRGSRNERRRQCLRIREPRQCDDRPGSSPHHAQRRRRLAAGFRQEHLGSSRQIHLLRRGERSRQSVRALSR